jgi:hypothetical protein
MTWKMKEFSFKGELYRSVHEEWSQEEDEWAYALISVFRIKEGRELPCPEDKETKDALRVLVQEALQEWNCGVWFKS